MAIYTNHSTYELLQACIEKRHKSPLIEELCQRLENSMDLLTEFSIVDNKGVINDLKKPLTECPVCEAKPE